MAKETIPDNSKPVASKPVAEIYAGTDKCLALIKRIAERYNSDGDGEDETDHQELDLDFHN